MLLEIDTEKRNKKTMNFDTLSIKDAVKIMNEEDQSIIKAVEKEIDNISSAIELTTKSLKNGGRIIYIGAGTSGRLGVLDAVECPPTFGVKDDLVIGLIAGGDKAFVKAVEGAEDSKELAIDDLKKINLNDKDSVIGIAASGRTPYVIGALEYANSINASTIAISCSKNSKISEKAKVKIELLNGPEVLTGSTRLKAGTSQKMVLNMISTISMRSLGKIYENLMIDVQSTNEKLIERSKNIIIEATGVTYAVAEKKYLEADKSVKVAIAMIFYNCDKEEAIIKIEKNNGFIRKKD